MIFTWYAIGDSGPRFLGGRVRANRLRNEILRVLEAQPEVTAKVDFSMVRGISHGLADELLSPLSEHFGKALPERVRFVNMASDVRETIEHVAEMHDLNLPEMG